MKMLETKTAAGESASDEELYALCRKYGENALYYRRKFIGLLPEVHKRKLYEKKKFESIFVFAAKLGGISEKHVRRVLNLEKRFEDKPVLKEMLVSGEVSANKLAKIVSIATVENQEALAVQVRLLPCRALETLARDERSAQAKVGGGGVNVDGLQEPLFGDENVHVSIGEPRLDDDVKSQLADLQEKGIDINDLIRQMLEKRDEELEARKDAVARKTGLAGAKANTVLDSKNVESANHKRKNSRYISVHVKRILREEYGDKCSISGCKRPSEQLHHTQRFALSRIHDPRYLAPMCEDHHKIAHSIDIRFHQVRGVASG